MNKKSIKKDILFDPNQSKSRPDYYFWDFQSLDEDQKELYQTAAAFDQSHTLSITQYFNNMSHSFHFSGQNADRSLNQRLLEKMDCINAFIDYFKDKLNTIKELSEIYEHRTPITQLDLTKPVHVKLIKENPRRLDLQKLGQYTLNFTSDVYLSENERNCLKWLQLGKSAETIAKINSVSRKTIERHIASIKEKFDCYTLFQLDIHVGESKLANFLHPRRVN